MFVFLLLVGLVLFCLFGDWLMMFWVLVGLVWWWVAGLLFWLYVCCFVVLVWRLLDTCGCWGCGFVGGWLPLFRVLRMFVIVVDLVVILFVWYWCVGLVMVVSCCFGLL